MRTQFCKNIDENFTSSLMTMLRRRCRSYSNLPRSLRFSYSKTYGNKSRFGKTYCNRFCHA